MAFDRVIRTEEELRELIPAPPPERLSVAKEIDHLDAHCREWIAASPLVFVASADAEGRCDVSPRGGPPGWVRVLDEGRLALPEAPGNRRADTLRNVLENPTCALIFLVPGRRETLRVAGRAEITTDAEALEGIPGRPVVALGVEVEAVFFHCAKALIRSGAWSPGEWPDASGLATLAEALRDHAAINGRPSERGLAEEQVAESLEKRMW